jgi:hypothetical protein
MKVFVFTSCHKRQTLREAFRVAQAETNACVAVLRGRYDEAKQCALRRKARLEQRDEAIRLALVDAPFELVSEPKHGDPEQTA